MSFNENQFHTSGKSFAGNNKGILNNAIKKSVRPSNRPPKQAALFQSLPEMKCGGEKKLHKMGDGGFLGGYTLDPFKQQKNRKDLGITAGTNWSSRYGLQGSLGVSRPLDTDSRSAANISGSIYGGQGGSGVNVGAGYGYQWSPSMGTFIRGDAGYDSQMGLNAGFEAGHRFNLLRNAESKSGAKQSAGLDLLGFAGVHSKADQGTLASEALGVDKTGNIKSDVTGLERNIKFGYGIGANYQRELGPGTLSVYGKAMVDPIAGKFSASDAGNVSSERVNFKPTFTIGANYGINAGGIARSRKIGKLIAKQEERDAQIFADEQRIARDKQIIPPVQGEGEFVRARPIADGHHKDGGEVMELTDKEIQELRKGGHVVVSDAEDFTELTDAQIAYMKSIGANVEYLD